MAAVVGTAGKSASTGRGHPRFDRLKKKNEKDHDVKLVKLWNGSIMLKRC